MKQIRYQVSTLPAFLAALLAVPALCAAATMTSIEHRQAMQRADSDYKTAVARCDTMAAEAKRVCKAEAKAAAEKTKARIDAAYRTSDTQRDTKIEDAKADRVIEQAKCDALSGDAKDACRKRARAAEEQAIAGARDDDAQRKLDVDYDAEVARCGTLGEAAKLACLGNAKAKYGKYD